MKLVTFLKDGMPEIGVLTSKENEIIRLQTGMIEKEGKGSRFFTDMLAFLEGGVEARDKAMEIKEQFDSSGADDLKIPVKSAELLSPVPRPQSVRDCMAFEQHIINCIRVIGLKKLKSFDEWIEKRFGRKKTLAYKNNKTWYERPVYYKSNRFSVVGSDAKVSIPDYTKMMDYELEWGVFIGKKGQNIKKENAKDYIGGYTVFNDFSARDIQGQEMGGRLGPAKGKDFDTGNAIGPVLVTPDEVPDPYNLTMTARINGKEWSRGSTKDMYWTFEDIISYISQSETLHPGEFIGSGTCSGDQGCGCGLEMGKFLKAGDVVELEVEKLGVLKNTLIG